MQKQWLRGGDAGDRTDDGRLAAGMRSDSGGNGASVGDAYGGGDLTIDGRSDGGDPARFGSPAGSDGEKLLTDSGGGEDLAAVKSRIIRHSLFPQLLAAHLACLRVTEKLLISGRGGSSHHEANPLLAGIANLDVESFRQSIIAAAAAQNMNSTPGSFPAEVHHEEDKLDQFMVNYISLLQSFKKQLQDHLTTQTIEAITACWEIEQSLYELTGVCVGASTTSCNSGSLMPHEIDFIDRNDQYSWNNYAYTFDQKCILNAFTPHGIDKTFMHHIQSELKKEFKEDYASKLREVREEIMRKRRTGKLPKETSSVLKDWWANHDKWPYPTEEDKAKLAEESGLELKQINNWFINQRKRIWQVENNTTQSTTSSNEETTLTTTSCVGKLALDANVIHGYYDDHDKIERIEKSMRNNIKDKSPKCMRRRDDKEFEEF